MFVFSIGLVILILYNYLKKYMDDLWRMNGAMNIGSRYIGSIVMFLNIMKVFVVYKESAISNLSVRGRVWGPIIMDLVVLLL